MKLDYNKSVAITKYFCEKYGEHFTSLGDSFSGHGIYHLDNDPSKPIVFMFLLRKDLSIDAFPKSFDFEGETILVSKEVRGNPTACGKK